MRILVLTDRDWTHPQGGGTGANLYAQVGRWVAWGHEVCVVACGYPGAASEEQIGAVRMIRVGTRSTVFPRVIWRGLRGLADEHDVVLEVVNGISFLTPFWLTKPRVALVHHVHREHYVREMGRKGRIPAFLLETAPLKWLYRDQQFITVSNGTAQDLRRLGIENIEIAPNGVQIEAFQPGERAPEPTLLYLGRLKRYKRIETLLDVLERVPEARLEIAGDGDHRKHLEKTIACRGLADRVTVHGPVSEERKRALYGRAWLNVTASAAEGWCLSVTEAAASATPTAALRVGGLPDAVKDGQTGYLAGDGEELARRVKELLDDPALRERMGEAARVHAESLDWDDTARITLGALERERAENENTVTIIQSARVSDTGKATALAMAQMAANFLALVFTIVFARLLGASDYGSLAALLSMFLILSVPGLGMQVLVAREVSTRVAIGDEAPAHGLHRWLGHVLLWSIAITAAAVILREPLAHLIGVPELPWAAAAPVFTGCMWLLVMIERGALQGLRHYGQVGVSIIGEATGRLVFGLILVGAGLGVTGAFLGTALALVAVAAALFVPLEHELRRESDPKTPDRSLRELLMTGIISILGLGLLMLLQNIDVLIVKHKASDEAAGDYAAAAVAAKAMIWVAVGMGYYLLPEATRRTKLGEDARPILVRTLLLIAVVATPMLLVYAVAAEPVLSAVFDLPGGAGALPWLSVAMTALACTYLAVQYLLALRRWPFLILLAGAVVAEVVLLWGIADDITQFSIVLAAIQVVLALTVGALGFRRASARRTAEAAV
ncbi:MAG: glycosyltransferase [Thermoleophilaceae bacterium]|nr:glycosyltransferase [Thermoleophilaceae bacterium]